MVHGAMSGWNIPFFLSLLSAMLLGLLFDSFDAPLIGSDGIACRELLSSGSDDDTIPAFLLLLSAPAMLRLFRNGLYFNWVEWMVLSLAIAPFVIYLVLIPDCAHLGTNIAARNIPLTLIALSLVSLIAIALRLSGPDQCRIRPPRR
ncbi:hypothetical protein BMI90_06395 [Thioclava sp. L04-15]|nr:hypothetical protein BMI90_06395 [Thioclava sp. L04-15]